MTSRFTDAGILLRCYALMTGRIFPCSLSALAARGGEITEAHRRAAEYWRWRITAWPPGHRAQSEAGYHLLQVSERQPCPGAAGPSDRHRPHRQRDRASRLLPAE
jgi:hypothetical protein